LQPEWGASSDKSQAWAAPMVRIVGSTNFVWQVAIEGNNR